MMSCKTPDKFSNEVVWNGDGPLFTPRIVYDNRKAVLMRAAFDDRGNFYPVHMHLRAEALARVAIELPS